MLGAYPIATRPLATLPAAGGAPVSLWINTRLELDGAAESGIVQNFWGAGAISLFGYPTVNALVSPVHQTYSDTTIVIDPSGDALATPDHRLFSDSTYAYRPGIEQHYIQTNASPDFMWAPSGADGVENANGIYTLFVKVLQTDPRTTDYWRFMTVYDNAATNELQTTDYIAQLYTYDDRILFGGNRSTSGLNYQFQPAATSAGAQGIQVFSTRVNLNTNQVRSRISAGGVTLYESTDFTFVEDRDPLHVAINTYVRVISGVHTGQSQYAKFKFIACGLVAGEATSAKLASYSISSDARPIWNTDLYAYWTASSLYDSSSPKLKNLGSTSTPMYLNSLGFADRATLPSANIADAYAGSILNTTHESAQTPIDADVLVEITVASTDLFIEAHMPLIPEGDALISPIHYTLSDYTIDTDTYAVSNQLVSSFDAVRTPVDPDVVSGVLSATSANATTAVDPDTIAGIVTAATSAARAPVDSDAVSGLVYEAKPAVQIITDIDVISLSEYGAITDERLVAFAKGLAGIDVSSSEYAQAYVDADVSVIVNVTATDLDIEARIPTVTDDVFLVEENNAQWASVRTPVDADVVITIINTAPTTDLFIEAHVPAVTSDGLLAEITNSASATAQAAVDADAAAGILNQAAPDVQVVVSPDALSAIGNTSSLSSEVVTDADIVAGLSSVVSANASYEYEGGVEQHYLQTVINGFMWSPNAAAGIETVTGTYTVFVKILQMYLDGTASGGCFISMYDDSPVYPNQVINTISSSYYYDDVIQFDGYRSDGNPNYFGQSQYSWQTTPITASITVDTLAGTVTYRAYHKVANTIYNYTDYPPEIRSPLHVAINAIGLNFGAFHAGIASFAQMKFVAAGLVEGDITDQQIQDYAYTKDARGVFGNSMRSYWVASTLQGDLNIDPFKSLPDLVGNYPMLVNGNILRSDMFPIPKPNQFTAETGIADYLASKAMVGVDFDSTTLAGIIDGSFSPVKIPVSSFSFTSIVYPSVAIYVSTKVTVEPDAYLTFAVKCVKAYLTNEPGTQATLVDSAGTEALFVNEPGTIAVLIKCR